MNCPDGHREDVLGAVAAGRRAVFRRLAVNYLRLQRRNREFRHWPSPTSFVFTVFMSRAYRDNGPALLPMIRSVAQH